MELNLYKLEIDNFLEAYFKNKGSYNKIIYEAMSYSINIGGKRIRPILMLLSYNLYKKDYEKIIPMAAAIEMIHTYSLIHDDLPCMDNDDLRRGKPTNHKVYGEAIAVLAGDGLLNEAFNVMLQCEIEDNLKIKVMNVISKSASSEGMIGGQIVDLLSENKKIDRDKLNYMHSKKTGELIKSPIIVGAMLGGASKKDLELLEIYGSKLGVIFQIKDDILDVEGSKEKLGKNTQMDEYMHKTNFVTLYGVEKCRELLKEMTEECFLLLDKIDGDTRELKDLTKFLLHRDY